MQGPYLSPSSWKLTKWFLLLTVAILWISQILFGQAQPLGEIDGVVRDSSQAVVPNASVEVVNLKTGAVRDVKTSSLGYYTAPLLPPDDYKITVSMTGFGTQVRPLVPLQVGQRLEADFVITPATQANTVTVTEQAPILSTNTHTGEVITEQQTVELPLNGREFSELILLAPGASPVSGAMQTAFLVQQGAGGVSPSVNGQSGRFDNYSLDGINNEEEFTQRWAISPPPDAIQEFRESDDQNYGGTSVNVATKAGTNQFHGDIWEFLRNDDLDARNTFNSNRLPYRQNQYGFTAGGPLYIPKLFDGRKKNSWLFFYWEGFRSNEGLTEIGTVPTAAMLGGDFTSFLGPQIGTDNLGNPVYSGEIYNPLATTANPSNPAEYTRQPFSPINVIPLSMIGTAQLAYAAHFFPTPNQNTFPNNLITSPSQVVATDQWGLRFDHRLGASDSFFARANVGDASNDSPSSLPAAPTFTVNRNRAIAGAYTHLFSPTMFANFAFGYTRDYTPFYNPGVSQSLQKQLGIATWIPPYAYAGTQYLAQEVGITSFSTPSQVGWFVGGPDVAYQFNGTGTKIWGNQTINFGTTVLRIRHTGNPQPSLNEGFSNLTTGTAGFAATTGSSLASFLLGLPDNSDDFIIPAKNIHWTIFDPFVEDQWKVTPKLTVNAGTHWTYFYGPYFQANGPTDPLNNAISIFNLATGQWQWGGVNPLTSAGANMPNTLYNPHYKNFGPNAGIAYQLTPRTVLRSGFSLAYDHGSQVQAVQADLGNYPYGSRAIESNINLVTPGPYTFTDPLPPLSSLSVNTTPAFTANPLDGIPYVMTWNGGVQRQLTNDMVLTVEYVGTRGRDIYMAYNVNTALEPGPGSLTPRQPFPQFGVFTLQTNRGKTNYDSLQAMLRKRFSHGLTFQASYTWSKALGDTVFYGNLVQNTYNVNSAYGPLNYDVPQMFVLSWVYQLPFGKGQHWLGGSSRLTNVLLGNWNASSLFSAYAGTPFSVTLPFDNANTGSSYELAELVGSPTPSGFVHNRQEWFNVNAFAVPQQYTYGNSGNGIVRAPGSRDVDFSVFKRFKVAESKFFEFRFEAFNIFNFTNLGSPGSTVDAANFGTILSASAPREIQFALKFNW
jgi:hypothetical protein